MRGDHWLLRGFKGVGQGTPPHVQGPHFTDIGYTASIGINPACTGTTTSPPAACCARREHPRVRGDHTLR